MIALPSTTQRLDYTCGAAALLAVCSYYGVGPDTEAAVVEDMGFGVAGSDPAHLIQAIRRYRLAFREYRPMSPRQLARCLDRGRPVIVMLQAWRDAVPVGGFAHVWDSGHWVVAIGHDARGVYFEDPQLQNVRGFLSHDALAERWHDIEGPQAHRVERYGLEVWRQRVVHHAVVRRARPIE